MGQHTANGAGESHYDGSLHSEARREGGESERTTDVMRRVIDNIQEAPEKGPTCVYDFRHSCRGSSMTDRPIGHAQSLAQVARLRRMQAV